MPVGGCVPSMVAHFKQVTLACCFPNDVSVVLEMRPSWNNRANSCKHFRAADCFVTPSFAKVIDQQQRVDRAIEVQKPQRCEDFCLAVLEEILWPQCAKCLRDVVTGVWVFRG